MWQHYLVASVALWGESIVGQEVDPGAPAARQETRPGDGVRLQGRPRPVEILQGEQWMGWWFLWKGYKCR